MNDRKVGMVERWNIGRMAGWNNGRGR